MGLVRDSPVSGHARINERKLSPKPRSYHLARNPHSGVRDQQAFALIVGTCD